MGARLLKVSEMFLTGRTEWKNTGGLIGMILTLADSAAASQASTVEEALKKARSKAHRLGISDDPQKMQQLEKEAKAAASNALTIFAPPNLNHTLATARRYVFRKGMPVDVHEIRADTWPKPIKEGENQWAPLWADENIRVWAMSILPAREQDDSSKSGSTSISPRKRSIDEVYASENRTVVDGDLSPEDRDYLTVKAVVSEMFNSSWRLDTLHETSLSAVQLPATIFVRNTETNKIQKYTGPLPGGPQPVPDPDLKVLVRKPWPGALVDSLPPTEPAKEAVSYIIRNHVQRGKFRPEKAIELKVPKGKAWAALSKGESVQSEDGQTITPDMVLEPSRVGGGMAVVDLPGPEYIDNLINRPEWREPKVMEGVGAVMWMCGEEVAQDSRLRAFMDEFKKLQHIVSSPDYCPNRISLDSAAAATVRLGQVDPDRYGVPVHDALTADEQLYGGSARSHEVRRDQPLPEGVHIAERGQQIQLEPSIAFQTKEVVPLLQVPQAMAEVATDVMAEAAKARAAIKTPDEETQRWRASLPPGAADAEIITLGTGSALPSKYRNVSATLVLVPDWGNVLLDCGENTLGQLKRVFTADQLRDVLQNLKMIVISHMHADHQLGTTGVVKAWYEEVHGSRPAPLASTSNSTAAPDFEELFKNNNRLAVVSEPAMQAWLAEYSAVEDYGYSRLAPLFLSPSDVSRSQRSKLSWFIPPSQLRGLSQAAYKRRMEENIVPCNLLNLEDIQAVQVKHCHGARAVSITLPSGFKVSYSGDCRPSKPFAQIGRDSTVCIHEATFDDELQGDAEAKNHSTTSEALSVAQNMRAKACVLTHFSQRYQKVPILERADDAEEPETEDISMTSSTDDVQDAEDGPIQDTAAATFPDQETSNDQGKQYELPSAQSSTKIQPTDSTTTPSAPEAVKFKLKSDMKVCIAFDYMRVKVGDIVDMEKFTPALLKLFAEEEKEMVERMEKTKANAESATGHGGGGGGKRDKKKGNGGR